MSLPVAAAPGADPRPHSWARLAVKAVLVVIGAAAVTAVVALLGSHRADAATPPAGERAIHGGAPGSLSAAPIAVRHQLRSVPQQVAPATATVRQTLQPVGQQLAPATSPVRQTLRPVVQEVAPATAPVQQTLRPVVQEVAPATSPVLQVVPRLEHRALGAPSPAAPTSVATPSARSAASPWPSSTAEAGNEPPSSGSPQAGGLPVGSSSSALDARGATTLGAALSRSSDGVGLPASTAPFSGGTVPTPVGAGGPGHGGAGLSALLAARWLVLGLLAIIIGLIAHWSAGRPAPRPEVSPA